MTLYCETERPSAPPVFPLTGRAMSYWPVGPIKDAHWKEKAKADLPPVQVAALERLEANLHTAGSPETWFEFAGDSAVMRVKTAVLEMILDGLAPREEAIDDLVRACLPHGLMKRSWFERDLRSWLKTHPIKASVIPRGEEPALPPASPKAQPDPFSEQERPVETTLEAGVRNGALPGLAEPVTALIQRPGAAGIEEMVGERVRQLGIDLAIKVPKTFLIRVSNELTTPEHEITPRHVREAVQRLRKKAGITILPGVVRSNQARSTARSAAKNRTRPTSRKEKEPVETPERTPSAEPAMSRAAVMAIQTERARELALNVAEGLAQVAEGRDRDALFRAAELLEKVLG